MNSPQFKQLNRNERYKSAERLKRKTASCRAAFQNKPDKTPVKKVKKSLNKENTH